MQRPLGAQISHMLRARGVEVIFGIPGVHNQELYRGIEEAGIAHVLARHEQGAGFMADGYARATGKPGVAYVITGPGLCNIMTPMGQAYSDSVPMLVISSCLDDVAATKGQLHQMRDQRAAAETVCDWSEQAVDADAAYRLIDRALLEFKTGRARPKHVQVPIAQLQAMADAPPAEVPEVVVGQRGASASAVARIVKALKSARRPLLVLGGGATDGEVPYGTLADRAGAGVFCTYAARGIMPPDHPLYFGSTLARPDSVRVLKQADLILAVGTELSQVDLWRNDLGHDCPMIRVDIDASQMIGESMAGDLHILGDACPIMQAVCDGLEGHVPQTAWRAGDVAAARAQWRRDVDAERPGILPVCDALREVLSPETM
ncbi:MAG: thiamine pyrophosphate-binding protein, partial [Roseobacter sp.]